MCLGAWQAKRRFPNAIAREQAEHGADLSLRERSRRGCLDAEKEGYVDYLNKLPPLRSPSSSQSLEISSWSSKTKNTFAWGFGRYKFQHEPIFYAHLAGQKDAWYGDKSQSTLWQEKKPAANRQHPTAKPVELVDRALVNSSKAGDLVADLFGGSGSTLMACERRGRHARLLEIDPKYCDVIVKRWQQYTGRQAILDGDGRPDGGVGGVEGGDFHAREAVVDLGGASVRPLDGQLGQFHLTGETLGSGEGLGLLGGVVERDVVIGFDSEVLHFKSPGAVIPRQSHSSLQSGKQARQLLRNLVAMRPEGVSGGTQ
jgi:DNA methylase